ncbi:MAG TPA: glycosyltransferase, partial [Saprospiraceae bacterium]|nr:glycosyltransferase [Saprospiraceae bacterium]
MNIVLLNTYSHGGAGVACRRLLEGLRATQPDISAQLITAAEAGSRWPFYAERLSFLPHERDRSVRFAFSPANFGKDLSRHPAVRQADLLHLHWVNQGLLSLRGIRQLAELGKPMVWTLHDTWAFTGGCHIFTDCDRFRQQCGVCPYLRRPGPHDLSHQVWLKKQRFFPKNIHFVTCSHWLRDVARSSSLLQGFPITSIPNPIDTALFKPAEAADRAALRAEMGIAPGAHVLLFVAMNLRDAHKGFRFLPEALQHLRRQRPDLAVEVVVLGKSEPESLSAFPYPVHALGLVQGAERLSRLYGAADVFVTPSLADNLPNTVMESLACGTPVVGFRTGGIPEMVGHLQEGY